MENHSTMILVLMPKLQVRHYIVNFVVQCIYVNNCSLIISVHRLFHLLGAIQESNQDEVWPQVLHTMPPDCSPP